MDKAWLDVPYHGENISGEYQIVYDRHQAAEMTNGNAQQLMRAAQSTYRDYVWEIVPIANSFIVEGTKRK
jgi:hypothetical protein